MDLHKWSRNLRLTKTTYISICINKVIRNTWFIQYKSCKQNFIAQRGLSGTHQSTEIVQKEVISAVTLQKLISSVILMLHKLVIVNKFLKTQKKKSIQPEKWLENLYAS